MQNLLRPGGARSVTTGLVGRAVPCPPDVSGCTDGGAQSRTCGTRPTLLSASASRPLNVAAPVRARTVGIPGPRSHVSTTHTRRAVDCAPYLTLYAFGQVWRAAILAAVLLSWVERVRSYFDRERSGAVELGDVARLKRSVVSVLFLRAWTPARAGVDLARGALGRRSSETRAVTRLPS